MTLTKMVATGQGSTGVEVEVSAEEEAEVRAWKAEETAKQEATAWLKHRREGKVTSHKDKDNNRIIDSTESGYPPISDQLDQIYHEGIDAWKVTIKAVKDAHPKP